MKNYLLACILTGLTVFFIARWLSNLKKIIAVCDDRAGVFTAIGAAKGLYF